MLNSFCYVSLISWLGHRISSHCGEFATLLRGLIVMNCEKLQSNTGREQSEIYLLSMNEKEILIGFVHIWVTSII